LIDKVVDYLPRWKAYRTYVSNDRIGFPDGTGFLIFRQVEITIVLVGERHIDQALDQKDRVSSDYETYHNPVNLAEKADPCMRNKELMQELERKQLNEVANDRCMIKHSSPHCYTYVSNDCIGFPDGTGFLIFRQMEITIILVREQHTNQALDQKDCVSSDYEPYHNPINLAKKANPCMRNKELMQELERKQLNEVTNGRCMIKHSKLGFHNR
jgi:hypothetical protein